MLDELAPMEVSLVKAPIMAESQSGQHYWRKRPYMDGVHSLACGKLILQVLLLPWEMLIKDRLS